MKKDTYTHNIYNIRVEKLNEHKNKHTSISVLLVDVEEKFVLGKGHGQIVYCQDRKNRRDRRVPETHTDIELVIDWYATE